MAEDDQAAVAASSDTRRGVLLACGLLLATAGAWWLAKVLVFHQLRGTALGHALRGLTSSAKPEIYALIGVGAIPLIFLAELVAIGWRESSLRRVVVRMTPSAGADLFMFLMHQIGFVNILAKLFTLGLATISGEAINRAVRDGLHVNLVAFPGSFALQFAAFFVVSGFLDYWNHRIQHTSWFWPLHRFHHSADDFCILTSDRVHPADGFWNYATVAIAVALLGTPVEVVLAYALYNHVLQYVRHTRADWDFGLIGRWLVQSPAHHRLHHGLEGRFQDCHYSTMPLWDHVFGTFVEAPAEPYAIGVEYPYRDGAGVVADLWRDYSDVWIAAARDLKKLVRMRVAT